jgi:hypothetical protein
MLFSNKKNMLIIMVILCLIFITFEIKKICLSENKYSEDDEIRLKLNEFRQKRKDILSTINPTNHLNKRDRITIPIIEQDVNKLHIHSTNINLYSFQIVILFIYDKLLILSFLIEEYISFYKIEIVTINIFKIIILLFKKKSDITLIIENKPKLERGYTNKSLEIYDFLKSQFDFYREKGITQQILDEMDRLDARTRHQLYLIKFKIIDETVIVENKNVHHSRIVHVENNLKEMLKLFPGKIKNTIFFISVKKFIY